MKNSNKIKGILKVIFVILSVFVLLILILVLSWNYITRWRLTDVGREESPEGKFSILFQEKGEPDFPFGYSHAKITVYKEDKPINTFFKDIADDGASFREDNYSVEWLPVGVVITFHGSEQADEEVEIFYEDGKTFEGYTADEIKEILKSRYPITEVESIKETKKGFDIRADGISFYAKNDMALHDSFLQEYYKRLTEEIFPDRTGRGVSFTEEEGETEADIRYIPVIALNGSYEHDIDVYCDDICEWIGYCLEKLPYERYKEVYTCFIPEIYGYDKEKYYFSEISIRKFAENEAGFYNELYTYLYNILYNREETMAETTEEYPGSVITEEPLWEIDDETIGLWASYEPDEVYDFSDGSEYALIPVDRALGSSYYVLMSFKEKGNKDTAELVNMDPYNGSGGEAGFLTFIDDSDIGFSCLSYSGGSLGLLYRTGDRGKSFEHINLPSPMIALPNGKYYNPFVMPNEAWAEGERIYLKVGQGAEGDYHNEELGGKTCGIYASDDKGKTFYFVREELEESDDL
ncbi:MAG: hypothetical protein K6B28_13900 [Lachnospiraceae bacterium]|nr:hypothetical protein [Lachnospiraceae bacterium]